MYKIEIKETASELITFVVAGALTEAIQLDSAIEAADRSLETLRELDRQTIQYVSQGSALKSDLLNITAKAASAEYEALVLRNKRADAARQLNNLLGRQPESEIVLAGLALPTGSGYQQPTIDNRPDLRESEARIRQAELDLRLERGHFIPKASLQVTSATTSSINALPNTFSSAALVVRWEPYTWGRRKAEIAQKTHRRESVPRDRPGLCSIRLSELLSRGM